METSEKKIETNRRNAQKSTGPKSVEGKLRSRQNSRKHGACSALLVCANQEEAEAFGGLLSRVRADSNPVGMLEEIVVEEIASCYWKLGRCALWEQQILRTRQSPVVKAMLAKFTDNSLLKLPVSTDSEGSSVGSTPEGPFPWAFSELHMQLLNYEKDETHEKHEGNFLEDDEQQGDVKANHLRMEIHLKDELETVRRYEKSFKKDFYLAIDKLGQLQKLRKEK